MFNFKNIKYKNFNLKVMQSDIFSSGLIHYFTTRKGGDTPSPLHSFTLSAKDDTQYNNFAIQNQKSMCNIMGAKFDHFIMPNQQHTDKIAIIKTPEDIKKLSAEPFDGIITNLRNYPICLVFADCTPILIFDKNKKILSAVHAGWKGTALSIVKKAIELMRNEFNTNEKDIQVAIGAAICQKCFEVNTDVARQLAMTLNQSYDNIFLKKDEDKYLVDLKEINANQLKEIGIENIDVCEYCTSCNNDIFYSYRADNKCTGRHGMLAMLEE